MWCFCHAVYLSCGLLETDFLYKHSVAKLQSLLPIFGAGDKIFSLTFDVYSGSLGSHISGIRFIPCIKTVYGHQNAVMDSIAIELNTDSQTISIL